MLGYPQQGTLLAGPVRSYNRSTVGTFTVKFTVSHPLSPGQRLELEGLVHKTLITIEAPMASGSGKRRRTNA